MKSRVLVVLFVLVALLAAAGCDGAEKALKPEPKVVTRKATVASPDAKVEGAVTVAIPDGLALWPGSTVVETLETEEAVSLTFTTTDEYEDVLAGLAKGLQDAGWTVEQESVEGVEPAEDSSETAEAGAMALLTISNATHEGVITLVENVDGGAQIDYVVSPLAP